MRNVLIGLICAVMPLIACESAQSAIVVISNRARIVTTAGPVNSPTQYSNQLLNTLGTFSDAHSEGAPFTPPSNGAYAQANQTSSTSFVDGALNVTASGMTTGQAMSLTGSPTQTIDVTSDLYVRFDVTDAPAHYAFSGTLSGPSTLPDMTSRVVVGLVDVTHSTWIRIFQLGMNSLQFDVDGDLPVGSYSLDLQCFRNVFASPTFTTGSSATASFENIRFSVTPTPEPGTLLTAGVAALWWTMRPIRRRR